ncbi:10022_t:CDS:2, partial [Funneliformis geosporum]
MSNISCLETLALNILNNVSPEKISDGINVSDLDPCSLCNQELFLYEIKKPFSILTCGHIYHRNCIESSIETSLSCLRPDCKKEVELVVLKSPSNLNDNDLMDISPSLLNDSPILRNHSQKKRSNDPLFLEVSPNKKDQEVIEGEMLQGNFFILFDVIVKMEERTEN